jgi:hypothetical protein
MSTPRPSPPTKYQTPYTGQRSNRRNAARAIAIKTEIFTAMAAARKMTMVRGDIDMRLDEFNQLLQPTDYSNGLTESAWMCDVP